LPCDPALLLAGRFGVAAAVVDPVVEALDAVVVGGAEVLMARETAEVHGGAVVGLLSWRGGIAVGAGGGGGGGGGGGSDPLLPLLLVSGFIRRFTPSRLSAQSSRDLLGE
jgi:hypothetical protein